MIWRGNEVSYIQNFTDIDDKVIIRAQAEGTTPEELAEEMIEEYFKDADGLNIMRATKHPRATESIDDIIHLISILFEKGFAYTTDDGVYFSIDQYPSYGKLSGHKLDDLIAGASERVSELEGKRNPLDFALWKFKKEGEPFWESPWGDGRPGWHIECSAMSLANLGETVDIHAGGVDLQFPHHENEIAQSEAATGKPFVRYWVHNGFVNVNYEKMSKSLGNFFTVRDLVEHYPYHILRFFILQAHYRMPINFSDDLLDAAVTSWHRIVSSVDLLSFVANASERIEVDPVKERELTEEIATCRFNWQKAMDDDLNTADAIAAIFDLVRAANTAATSGAVSPETLLSARNTLVELLDVLGLDPTAEKEDEIPDDILTMVEERTKAKKERDFATADRIRDEIQARGFKVEDTPQGARVIRIGS